MKNTLVHKIACLFLLLLLPLLLIGVYAINRSTLRLKEQILFTIHSNNTTFISQLDNLLDQIYFSNLLSIEQSTVEKLAYNSASLSDFEKSFYVNLLRENLTMIRDTNPFLESSHMFFKSTGIIYHSYNYRFGSYTKTEPGHQAFLDGLQTDSQPFYYYEDYLTGEPTLSVFVLPFTKAGDYGLILTLSIRELQNYLSTNAAGEGDFYYFTLCNDFTLTNLEAENYRDAVNLLDGMEKDTSESSYVSIKLDGKSYYAFYYPMDKTGGRYLRLLPTHSFLKTAAFGTYLLVLLCLIVFLSCIIFFAEIYRMVHKPLIQLTAAFTKLEKGNFGITISETKPSDFSYLYSGFNHMSEKLRLLIEKDYDQKLLLQKAELKQLQAQINPHFLYNSFFMLQRMIKTGLQEESLEMSDALGTYFRYITRNSMNQVSLAEEYEHAETYTYIQGLRFEGRVRILLEELPPDCAFIPVPKLILQPLLENAFNYGLSDMTEGGILKISFLNDPGFLTILIEDNGNTLGDEALAQLDCRLRTAKTASDGGEMSGILNIQRRLAIFSDLTGTLRVSRSKLGGLCVFMRLPKPHSPQSQ